MICVTLQMSETMSATNRLLCQEMLRRGWQVDIPYRGVPLLQVTRSDAKQFRVFSSTPPTTSYAAGQVANNKYMTAMVLEAQGIRQLPSLLVDPAIPKEVDAFLRQHTPVVAKPLDGAHGKGITVNITNSDQLERALMYAQSESARVILQKQFFPGGTPNDIRILVIDGTVIGAIHRIPARVKGDGHATVAQLIDEENRQPWRGEPYKAKLAYIDSDRARTFLGSAIDQIPDGGEYVTVMGVANYGAGGELVDVTDDLPQWMRDEAVGVASILELPVVGVDYMTTIVPTPDMPRTIETSTIVEVNKCPSLCIHDEPTVGNNRHATSAYVDYLENL